VSVPDTVLIMVVGTAARVKVLVANLDRILCSLESLSDSQAVQEIPVELPREKVTNSIHDLLVLIDRDHNWNSSFQEHFSDLLRLASRDESQLDLVASHRIG